MIGLLNSEYRKIVSLRFWWILGIVPLVVGLLSGAVTMPIVRDLESGLGGDASGAGSIAALFGVVVALFFVVLFAGIFAAVNVGNEFRYGTITPSFITTRSRDELLAAKVGVTSLFGIGYYLVVAVASSALLLMFGSGDQHARPWLALLASGLLVTLAWSLIGIGLGLLTRSTLASTITLIVWCTIGELFVSGFLSLFGAPIRLFLPGHLTIATVINAMAGNDVDELTMWPLAPVLLFVWAGILVGAGWFITRTRDVT